MKDYMNVTQADIKQYNDALDAMMYCYTEKAPNITASIAKKLNIATTDCCFYPRGNGKSSIWADKTIDWASKSFSRVRIPTDQEIRSKIVIYRDINPQYCQTKLTYRYNDGKVAFSYANTLNQDEIEPESIINQILDYIVDKVKDKYKELKIKEDTGMNMNDYNEFCKNLRMIGGSLEVECGDLFNQSMSKITIPTDYLKNIKIAMPTTTFDKKKDYRFHPGLDIPLIIAVDTYNDRVVKVTFADGTFTKSVCGKNDTFDIDVGITICVMKRIMGKDGHKLYNNLIRDVHATMDKNEKLKEKEKALKTEIKQRKRKAELKKAAKKAKARQEKIDIQKTAIIEANRVINEGIGDDLK